VDIAVHDGTAVYAVAPGYVHRYAANVTVQRPGSGREFGYWHIRPVVSTGQQVRTHQLLGYVLPGWGHVHFAESINGAYRNPLRPGALSPYVDRTAPSVTSIGFVTPDRVPVSAGAVRGMVDIEAQVSDTPPIAPRGTWKVARLTPAFIWWKLWRDSTPLSGWNLVADFHLALMPESLYNWVYAPGTYQNKANRPGNYLFWLTHGFDTTALADGSYRITVRAEDTRYNVGEGSFDFTVANGGGPRSYPPAPGVVTHLGVAH
jgi:hypothetical protein